MTSPASIHHLPSLPTETHAHILSFCDVPTLGQACSVSLAFLELAGPLLYRDVNITGFDQLQRMFYGEVRVASAPQVDRYLSLDQTRTFTFLGVPEDLARAVKTEAEDRSSQLFFGARSSCSFPVQVDRLDAYFPNLRANPGGLEDDVASSITGSIMNLFDPVEVFLASNSAGIDPLIIDIDQAPWTRLKMLASDDVTAIGDLAEADWFLGLAPQSLTLSFNLAIESEDMSDYLAYLLVNRLTLNPDEGSNVLLSPDWPQVKEIIVRVRDNEHRGWFQDYLRGGWDEHTPDLSAQERARREAMIRYIVG